MKVYPHQEQSAPSQQEAVSRNVEPRPQICPGRVEPLGEPEPDCAAKAAAPDRRCDGAPPPSAHGRSGRRRHGDADRDRPAPGQLDQPPVEGVPVPGGGDGLAQVAEGVLGGEGGAAGDDEGVEEGAEPGGGEDEEAQPSKPI